MTSRAASAASILRQIALPTTFAWFICLLPRAVTYQLSARGLDGCGRRSS
jgi:hypothetical protein